MTFQKSGGKLSIAVVCGGLSSEREVSLKSGQNVYGSLSQEKYNTSFIEIAKDGRWLLKQSSGSLLPKGKRSLALMDQNKGLAKSELKTLDLVFLVLHGKYGEDGRIQSLLDLLQIPYTGSNVLASAIGMNKLKTIALLENQSIKIPETIALFGLPSNLADLLTKIQLTLAGFPVIVKPNGSGSSVAVSIVKNKNELIPSIKKAFNEDSTVLIQKYIKGREITCGVWGDSEKTPIDPLPPIEIIVHDEPFFDYQAKYLSQKTEELCPAPLDERQTQKVQNLAIKVHTLLGCDGLTRSDFILSEEDQQFYFLEINTIPGLTKESLCPKEAKVAGLSFSEFLDKQIELALLKQRPTRFNPKG